MENILCGFWEIQIERFHKPAIDSKSSSEMVFVVC